MLAKNVFTIHFTILYSDGTLLAVLQDFSIEIRYCHCFYYHHVIGFLKFGLKAKVITGTCIIPMKYICECKY